MKKDLIERLRESLDEERDAAARAEWWESEATNTAYEDAKAETDRLVDKLGKRTKLATGGMTHGGGRIIGDQGGVERLIPGHTPSIQVQVARNLEQSVIQPLSAVTARDFDREAWRRGYHR